MQLVPLAFPLFHCLQRTSKVFGVPVSISKAGMMVMKAEVRGHMHCIMRILSLVLVLVAGACELGAWFDV